MENNLKKLDIFKFKITVKCIEEILLPIFAASTVRGAFGIALKKTACVQRKWKHDCDHCLLKSTCVYSYLFETKGSINNSQNLKLNTPSHPFIFDVAFNDSPTKYPVNSNITWELTLIGNRVKQMLPYIIFALEKMGNSGLGKTRGKFEIDYILMLGEINPKIIYNHSTNSLDQDIKPLEIEPTNIDISKIKIEFKTPLRIKKNGKYILDISFEDLIKNILRRYSILLQYHQDGLDSEFDFENTIKKASNIKIESINTRWVTYNRYSGRQKQWIKQSGCIGSIEYSGNITPFMPILEIGTLINIGKGTVFGFGKYQLNHNKRGLKYGKN